MKNVTPRTALWVGMVFLVAYWSAVVVVDPLVLRDIFNNITLGVAVTVALTWASGAWTSFREGADDGDGQLVIAVFLLFSVLAFQRMYAIVALALGRPTWLVEGPLSGFSSYLLSAVGLLFLVAPGISPGAPRNRYWIHILSAVAGGSLVAGILIGKTLPF
jgi:hypothetical protein